MKSLKRATAFLLCFCMVLNLSVPEALAFTGSGERQSAGDAAYSVATGSDAEKEEETEGDRGDESAEDNGTEAGETENGSAGDSSGSGTEEDIREDESNEPATPSDAEREPLIATAADARKVYDGYYEIAIVNNNDGYIIPIQVDRTYQLEVKVTPESDETPQPSFESNDTVAAVDAETGLITAVSTGYANITALIEYENENGSRLHMDSVSVEVIKEEPVVISLHANGGLFDDDTEEKQRLVKPESYMSIPSVHNGEKVLRGWYSDSACTQLVTEDSSLKAQKSMDLYAGWVDTYTIVFDYGGYSDGEVVSREVKIGQGMKIGYHSPYMPSGPSEETNDKMFAGWLTEGGVLYADNDIRNYKPSGNEIITAQWVDYYTIKYDYNGVKDSSGEDSSYEYVLPGNKVKKRPSLTDDPENTNNKMLGGWKNSEGKIISHNDLWNYSPKKSETLTAQWYDYYVITFDYNGVEYNGNKFYITNVMQGDTVSAPYIPSDPGQTGGKILVGWKISGDRVLTSSQIGSYRPMENETIIAQWAEYNTITFDYDGVTYNGVTKKTYQAAKGQALGSNYAYIPKTPESTGGRMFTGWKTESGIFISSNDIQDYIPSGSETLTAQWSDDYYTITFDYNGVTYDGEKSYTSYALPGKALLDSPYISSDTSKTEGKALLGWEISGRLIAKNELYEYVPAGNETLTAQWTEDIIPITFDYNGIAYNGQTSSITNVVREKPISSYPSLPSNPDDTQGKLFAGWENEGKLYMGNEISKIIPKEAMTFTAKWTSNYYTVTLDYNGIKYDGKLFKEHYILPGENLDTTPGIPNQPYEAYNQVLIGWQTPEGELISNNDIGNYVPSGDVTLTARWTKYITVTYDANGGKLNGSNTKEYVPVGEAIKRGYGPTKEGFKFAGWYEKETGKKADNNYYIPDSNVTLVAEWKEFYTITYDANGGSYTYDSYKKAEVIKGESEYLNQEYGYSRDGFTLEGWCEDKACTGPVLTENYTPEKDITLYAKWSSYYTITLEAGIGTLSKTVLTVIQGETIGNLATPYSGEAAFEGWYLDEGFTKAVTRAYVPTADTTLYAKWSQDTYRVTFHAGGAWVYDDVLSKYTSEVTWKTAKNLPLAKKYINTNRSGYDCVWYLDQDCKTPFNWSSAIEADLDLYAVWSKQVTVFWNGDGGRNSSGKAEGSLKTMRGEFISLPDVEKDGYAFTGWVTESGEEVTENTKFFENTYIRAVWEEGYRITLETDGGILYNNDYYKPVFYVKKGKTCGYKPAPVREGHAFLGWFDENGSNIGRISAYAPVKDTTLTARWSDEYATVRFHYGEAEVYDDYTGNYVQLLEVRLPKNKSYYEVTGATVSNPQINGKTSTGWALKEGAAESVDLTTYLFKEDTDLYPIWKDCWYIAVEPMGGSIGTNGDQHTRGYKVAKGEALKVSYLAADKMLKSGYIFDGWYDNIDYTGEKYTIPFKPTGNMTLYAKWLEGDAEKFTISYDTAGGNAMESVKVSKGKKMPKPQDPEKDGSIFDGWYLDSDYLHLCYFTEPVYKDVTLYAKWSQTSDVKDASVKIDGEYTYTGELIVPGVTVKLGKKTLVKDTDYSVSGGGTNAGDAVVTITGINDYTGSKDVTFKIKKAPTEADAPKGPFVFTYGQKFKEVALPEGWNWKTPDSLVGDAGTRQASLIYAAADANHEDATASVKITVNPLDITGAVVTLSDVNNIEYDGSAKKPPVYSVTLNGVRVSADEYVVSYTDNTDPGIATVTVTGKGNYTGTAAATFTIKKGNPELIIGNKPYEAVFGSKLSSIALPEGWTWQNPETSVGAASDVNKSFKADFKAPADSKYNDKTDVDLKVHVIARTIKDSEVTLEEPPYVFNNAPVEPAVTVVCDGVMLAAGSDYKLTYENNDKVGQAKAVISGIGNYDGSVIKNYRIIADPYDIGSAVITVTPQRAPYTGKAIEPAVTVTIDPVTLNAATDYAVQYENNVDPGQADVIVTGKGAYHGSQTVHFFIDADTYKFTAVYGSKLSSCALPKGWAWKNPEAYVGDVTSTGRLFQAVFTSGNVTEKGSFNVIVTPKDIRDESVAAEIDRTNLVYNKEELKPKVTIKDTVLGSTLTENSDYTVAYSDNTDAGKATVKITGIKNYSGIITDGFTIEQAEPDPEVKSDKIEDEKIHLTIKEEPFFLYVSQSGDGEIAYTSSDSTIFTVENKANEYDEPDGFITVKGIGTAELTIEIPETKNYKAAKLIYDVEVVPVKLTDSSVKLEKASYTYTGEQIKPSFTVVYGDTTLTAETDYTFSYGPNVKAGRDAGSVTVTGKGDYEGTVSASFTIEKAENPAVAPETVSAVYGTKLEDVALTGGWKWKNPQAYVGNAGTNSHDVVLAESDNYLEKTGVTAVVVSEKTLTDDMVTLEYEETQYDGTAKEPKVTVLDGDLITAGDYTVTYSENTELGAAVVEVTAKGNYTGTVVKNFTIVPAVLTAENVVINETFVYDGTAREPEPVVTVGGKLLVRDTDYEVSYKDNVNAGSGKAEVKGKGNYQGTVVVEFTIEKAETVVVATPSNLTAVYGDQLKDVQLPENFSWADGETYVGKAGVNDFTAKYTSPDPNYKDTDVTLTITVEKRTLKAEDFMLEKLSYVYDKTVKRPAVTSLVAYVTTEDYRVSYESNENAGTAYVEITGTGNCQGQVRVPFFIEKAVPVLTVGAGTEITRYVSEGEFHLDASISNDGTLTYASADGSTATVDADGIVKPVRSGTVIITVSYEGDDNYKAVKAEVTVILKRSGSSGGSSSGGSSSGGSSSGGGSSMKGNTSYSEVPEGYTGATKVIGNVTVPEYVAEGTWTQAADGSWKFTDKSGKPYVSSWAPAYNPHADRTKGQSVFNWFLFDKNGNMVTGWHTDENGNTFYLNPVSDNTLGSMVVGWKLIAGKYYYFNNVADGTRGKLLKDTVTPDGYYVDKDGVWNEKPQK